MVSCLKEMWCVQIMSIQTVRHMVKAPLGAPCSNRSKMGNATCCSDILAACITHTHQNGHINYESNCLWIKLSAHGSLSRATFHVFVLCINSALAFSPCDCLPFLFYSLFDRVNARSSISPLNQANKMIKACYKCKYAIWWFNGNICSTV